MIQWIKSFFVEKQYVVKLEHEEVIITIRCSEQFAKDFFEQLFRRSPEWERLKGTK